MRRTALAARVLTTIAAAVTLMLAAPSTVVGQGASDPFAAMSVQRPPQPVAAPDFVFVSAEGREVRLSELRGSVVLLGFFATT
jgi:cytochrome oxidase Cu insertion factor (SCO1/SenC/PrrC family)